MEDSFGIEISSALPFSEAQYDGLMQIVDNMDNCYNALEVKVPNHADFDDFMGVTNYRKSSPKSEKIEGRKKGAQS